MKSTSLRNRTMLACATLAIGACSQQLRDPAAELGKSGVDAECPTGSPLPITRLCSDGAASLFVAVDPKAEMFGPRCVWCTQEVGVSPSEALVFRAQDCSGEGWDQTTYSYDAAQGSGYLKIRQASMPVGDFGIVLEVIPLTNGQTAEKAAMHTLEKADPAQRTRCETHALPDITVAGRAFELGPNAELKAELEALYPDEPRDACGPNGVTTDAVVFWEGRDRHALFHSIGQDTPLWDPASFTFYTKRGDGAWTHKN